MTLSQAGGISLAIRQVKDIISHLQETGKSVKAIYARQLKDTVDFTLGIGVSGKVASSVLIAMGGSRGEGFHGGHDLHIGLFPSAVPIVVPESNRSFTLILPFFPFLRPVQ